MATVRRDTNEIVAHMGGVKKALRDELRPRAAAVRNVVRQHNLTGALKTGSQLTAKSGKVDAVIYIEDPAVYAINYGHRARDGSWVEGIHAIEAAL